MAFVSTDRMPWTSFIIFLLLLLAVNCRQNDFGFTRQRMIHRSGRSLIAKLWHQLGKPYRTLHSAHVLLLGAPKVKGNASHRTSTPKYPSSATSVFPYATTLPYFPVPATQLPSGAGDILPPLPADAVYDRAPAGNDPDLVTWNLRRLRTTYCGRLEPRTLDGEDTVPGEFPWLAIVKAERYYFPGKFMLVCGGSLINERYVLTAAHCVRDSRYKVTSVILGEYNTKTLEDECSSVESLFSKVINDGVCRTEPPVEIKVERVLAHPGYRLSSALPDDIALIRLQDPVEFSAYISPICLPLGDFDVGVEEDIDLGSNLTTVGWGMTMNDSRSSTPMKADVPLMDTAACRTFVSDLPRGKKCVGVVIGNAPCPGDSGGPLFAKKEIPMEQREETSQERSTRAVQLGIVSGGPRYCELRQHTLFTNVQDYLLWILANVEP